MQYILTDEFQAISETSGTLINISNVPAEISLSQTHGTGIILFPRQQLSFNKSVYAARAPGGFGTAVIAAIETGAAIGGGGSSNIEQPDFTQEDLNNVFNDSDFTATGGFSAEDINKVFQD